MVPNGKSWQNKQTHKRMSLVSPYADVSGLHHNTAERKHPKNQRYHYVEGYSIIVNSHTCELTVFDDEAGL